MNTHTNGGASGAAPLREKVTFATNVQTIVGLEFDPPSEAREGRFGDQFMYFLAEGKIMWADPPLHDAIVRSGARAGSELAITKQEHRQGNRKHIRWEALLIQEEPAEERVPAWVAPERLTAPAAKPHAAPAPAQVAAIAPSSGLMGEAIKQAIQACEYAGFDPRPEDIRALAITIYIQASGGKAPR